MGRGNVETTPRATAWATSKGSMWSRSREVEACDGARAEGWAEMPGLRLSQCCLAVLMTIVRYRAVGKLGLKTESLQLCCRAKWHGQAGEGGGCLKVPQAPPI